MGNDKYNLQQNESVIMKTEGVKHGGFMAVYSDELLLTNLNIILVKKGLLRNTKDIQYFPVNQIKLFNGKAQAIVPKQTYDLEVYFLNGQETFGFPNRKEAEKWADNINRLLTGAVDFVDNDNKAIPGTELIAETLKGTIDTFKGVFGKKNNDGNESKPLGEEQTAKYCASCGASIKGIKGRIVRCQYCDSEQQL